MFYTMLATESNIYLFLPNFSPRRNTRRFIAGFCRVDIADAASRVFY